MSDEKNRRVVKKTNTKKMSIKVSTEDKDSPLVNKLSKDKNSTSKNTKPDTKVNSPQVEDDLETRYNKLLEQNQNLESEIQMMKEELKSELEKTMTELSPLNSKLEFLNKEEINVCNENKSLLTKLKKMDKEITLKFDEKFKMSKIIEKKRAVNYNRDRSTEIKSIENEKNNVQKDIKINQREINRLNKILEDTKEGEEGKKLEVQYNELKKNIEEIQKEVNVLNLIKLHHKNCPKDTSILKGKLNVLNNDIEFEAKRKSMISIDPQKKEKSPITTKEYISGNKRIKYGLKVENKMLKSTQNKYDSKQAYILNQKSYNFIKDEMKEIENKKKNKSLEKLNKIDYDPEKEANNKLKENTKPYLFTEVEKEVFKNLMPNEYFNNLNEKYAQKETEMKEIEETCRQPKELKMKLYMDNLRYEEINLKQRELKMKKADLMSKHSKNSKKINDMKTKIKLLQNEINRESKKITRMVDYNNSLNEIIKKYFEKMKKEKEKEKEENKEQDNE